MNKAPAFQFYAKDFLATSFRLSVVCLYRYIHDLPHQHTLVTTPSGSVSCASSAWVMDVAPEGDGFSAPTRIAKHG